MRTRSTIKAAKQAAQEFIKAVEAWERAHPLAKTEAEQLPNHGDWCGFGNKESGVLFAQSIILTRRLAVMRR